MTAIPEYHSGTGKVIRPGDTVRIDGKGATYAVEKLVEEHGETTVHCYGGRPNRERYRVVHVDRVSRVTTPARQRVSPWAAAQ